MKTVLGALAAPILWWGCVAGGGLALPGLPRSLSVGLGAIALAVLALALDRDLLARRPLRWGGLPRGAVIGAALAMAAAVSGWSYTPEIGSLVVAHGRLSGAVAPGWAPAVGVLVAVAHELLFRGVLLERLGAAAAIAAWTLTVSPMDPLRGVTTGIVLTVLSKRCGVEAAVAAHLAWALAPDALSMGFTTPVALGVTGLGLVLAALPSSDQRSD